MEYLLKRCSHPRPDDSPYVLCFQGDQASRQSLYPPKEEETDYLVFHEDRAACKLTV